MKLAARDVLDIFRQFEVATTRDVPRQIERLTTLEGSPHNTIVSCTFHKSNYFILVDESAEDDIDYIERELGSPSGALLLNPIADIETFALPWRAKDVYLWRVDSQKRRLDAELAERYPEQSRSTWQKLIKDGQVRVDGVVVTHPSHDVSSAKDIAVTEIETQDFSDATLPVVYEDDNVIVVDKPIGILTHAKGALQDEFTVADFFARYTSHGSDTNRPGVVHRLDRDTSGVIIGAKNDETALSLKKQFSQRTVKKTYIAILDKIPERSASVIKVPIGRNPNAPSTFRADPKGKSAETSYEVIATNDAGQALVRLMPRTGRTHQLRVHMQFIKAPITGDRVYGREGERLFLHAHQLEVTIPSGNRQVFTADLPDEFLKNFPGVTL